MRRRIEIISEKRHQRSEMAWQAYQHEEYRHHQASAVPKEKIRRDVIEEATWREKPIKRNSDDVNIAAIMKNGAKRRRNDEISIEEKSKYQPAVRHGRA